jgi:CRISPR-associated protein Cmr2
MARMNDDLWKVKLLAWTHDPAEKALVLLRDPTGHEGGTVAGLRAELFGAAVPGHLIDIVKTADRWAAAADRPQFPQDATRRFQPWCQVRFDREPVLIHPLSGEEYDLGSLQEVDPTHLKAVSFDHFKDLVARDPRGGVQWRQTLLRFWRRGPDLEAPGLGALWKVLPADTRAPDHSIWEHLNLTSALAGAMLADPDRRPALLLVTLGPVQSFIAQARSTSDLWAGSHLLSRMAWEAIRVVAEALGPDALIVPDLHGVPVVDAWLADHGVLDDSSDLLSVATDANPLFAGSLPNRFLAVVPAAQAESLGRAIEAAARKWVRDQAGRALDTLLEAADLAADTRRDVAQRQVDAQVADFPDVHWTAVPWREAAALQETLARFYPTGTAPGFFGSPAWNLLSRAVTVDGAAFFEPNPGVLYAPLYDLGERTHAAARSTRSFQQLEQHGYRCELCGEHEWITVDRAQLDLPRRKRSGTPWANAERKAVAWARRGEHLCARCMLKRLWPRLFVEELEGLLARHGERGTPDVQRYVVSTHAMALVPTLRRLQDEGIDVQSLEAKLEGSDGVALPRALARDLLRKRGADVLRVARRVPSWLDESKDETEREDRLRTLRKVTGVAVERYHALVLMDGDRMGAWLASSDEDVQLAFRQTWHPTVRNGAESLARTKPALAAYLESRRGASPARHVAISRSLNGFSTHVAPTVVEDVHAGKLLYAGGDDVLAMVSLDQVLGVMLTLRCAYSGEFPSGDPAATWELLDVAPGFGDKLQVRGGHVLVGSGGRTLLRMMGSNATASMGVVIAHHTAPLGAVLRELRAAERRAKLAGGRDAYSITLMKRSGGLTRFTCKWFLEFDPESALARTSIGVLLRLRDALACDLSRRAAYSILQWLPQVPADAPDDMLRALVAHQLRRQQRSDGSGIPGRFDPEVLANDLIELSGRATQAHATSRSGFLADALTVAEFLAREGRARAAAPRVEAGSRP